MAFIPTPLVAKAVFEGVASGTPIINTLWFKNTAAWTSVNLPQLNNALYLWWTNWFKLYASDEYTLNQITSYDMSSSTGPKATRVVGEIGAQVGNLGSFQDVLTIKFGTANRGRSGRGRNDISPIREQDLANNVVTFGHRENVLDAYIALPAQIQGVVPNATHVVVSFQLDGLPRSNGLAQLVTSYESVTEFVRTRKSRRQP